MEVKRKVKWRKRWKYKYEENDKIGIKKEWKKINLYKNRKIKEVKE